MRSLGQLVLRKCKLSNGFQGDIFIFLNFIYLFLAALGLCCCWLFSSCSELGHSLVVGYRLLIVVASLVVEHRL